MTVWLWEAGNRRGVSDDLSRAREAAAASLRDGRTGSARVEQALLMLGGGWLTSGYQRTGEGWLAQPRRNGEVSWVPLASAPELAAS
jgi:hypothetical protein